MKESLALRSEFRSGGHPLGLHRVLSPQGVLPQAAERLDNSLPIYSNELLIEVNRLNLDRASFQQLWEKHGGEEQAFKREVLSIVQERGKLENPVTGSGGMLLGRVAEQGPEHPSRLSVDTKVATLVSLTLTPLTLESLGKVNREHAQIEAQGSAILFANTLLAPLPEDLPENLVLSLLDVCGAPAWVRRLVKPEHRVLILGFGKAGCWSALAALEQVPPEQLYILEASEIALKKLQKFPGQVSKRVHSAKLSAQEPLQVLEWVEQVQPQGFDVVIQTCSARETETAALLAAREGGEVLFFNMNTNFSRCVLSAEGLAKDLNLRMGTGFVPGHWEYALELARKNLDVFR